MAVNRCAPGGFLSRNRAPGLLVDLLDRPRFVADEVALNHLMVG
jgi:hypothetical protein